MQKSFGKGKGYSEVIIITLQVNAPAGSAQGIKEALAMYMEYFGDTKVLKIEEVLPEQIQMEGINHPVSIQGNNRKRP